MAQQAAEHHQSRRQDESRFKALHGHVAFHTSFVILSEGLRTFTLASSQAQEPATASPTAA